MIKRPRILPGDPITNFTADDYNAIVDEINRLSNLTVSAPLSLNTSPYGRVLSLTVEEPVHALLSGSSSPYSWSEVIPQAGDTWVSGFMSGSANAIEVNGRSNLGGKRVQLWPSPNGSDWLFQAVGYAPPTVAWKFRINGCTTNTGVPGAVIDLYQGGVLIDSCTTADGTGGTTAGECTMTVPTGSYDVVVSGPTGAGFAGQSFTASAIAGTTTRNLAADGSHVCVGAVCNFPIPKTLFTSDTLGTITLTWNGANWVGTAVQATNVRFIPATSICTTTGTTTVTYTLLGDLSALRIQWKSGCCANDSPIDSHYAADGSAIFDNLTASGSRTSAVCSSLSFTYSIPGFGTGSTCAGFTAGGLVTPGGAARTQAVTP